MDMGGVTDGGTSDPLHGIARFKRSICNQEMETGREALFILKPVRYFLYQALKSLHLKVKYQLKALHSMNSFAISSSEKKVESFS
jgi:hypothetical protein